MLKEIYDIKREDIDKIVKDALKKVENKLYKIDYAENKELIDKLEENYNIKLAVVTKEIYIKGLKDGINLINECKYENP